MHSFTTIALISTLSLGVHAASIGDSVSQLVSREQHNRLFHNPDFTSANLPPVESFEHSGKISPRKIAVDSSVGRLFNGLFTFDGNPVSNTANTQGVSNGQTFSSLDSATIGDILSGNAVLNTVNTQGVPNGQTFPSLDSVTIGNLLSGNAGLNTANTQGVPNGQTFPSLDSVTIGNLLSGNAGLNTANTQGVPNGQTFSSLDSVTIGNLLSGNAGLNTANTQAGTNTQAVTNTQALSLGAAAAIDPNAGLNTGNTQAINTQAVNNVQVEAAEAAIIAQSVQAIAAAQVAARNTVTAFNILAYYLSLAGQLLAANNQAAAAQAIVNAQAAAANALAASNVLTLSLNQAAQLLQLLQATLNAVVPHSDSLADLFASNAGSFSSDVGANQDSQQDAVKRQLPTLPITGTINQATGNALFNNTGVAPREDNTKYTDDQVEDMDFSEHDSEADELEEGF